MFKNKNTKYARVITDVTVSTKLNTGYIDVISRCIKSLSSRSLKRECRWTYVNNNNSSLRA